MSIKVSKVFWFLICVFCFFSYISLGIYGLLIVGIIGVLLSSYKNVFKIKKKVLYEILSAIVVLTSIIFSVDTQETILFGIVILAFSFITNSIMDKNIDYKRTIVKFMYLLSSIHVIAVILELIVPDIIMKINAVILTRESYSVVFYLFNQGKYSGIAPQTGTVAYFILVYLIISLFIFWEQKNIVSFCLNVVGFIALISTCKRAPLLVYILILFCCFAYYLITKNKGTNKIIINVLIGIVLIVMLIYAITAFGYLFIEGDIEGISSGRWQIYEFMINAFFKSPIIGNGFGYVQFVQGIAGHNIFLQLLCEYGLLAVVFFVWFFKNLHSDS